MTPKKMLSLGLTALVISLPVCFSAAAADMVGIIDSQKVLFQHPKFEAVAKHIVELSRQKENAIRFLLEKETDPEKKAGILSAANQEMAETEERLMSSIHKDCENALAVAMEKRKITIVLKKHSVYLGGADITEEVIAQLRSIARSQ